VGVGARLGGLPALWVCWVLGVFAVGDLVFFLLLCLLWVLFLGVGFGGCELLGCLVCLGFCFGLSVLYCVWVFFWLFGFLLSGFGLFLGVVSVVWFLVGLWWVFVLCVCFLWVLSFVCCGGGCFWGFWFCLCFF